MKGTGLKLIAICISLLLAAGCYFGFSEPVGAETAPPLVAGMFSLAGKRPTNLGVKDGGLAPCPNSPNCVSSYSTDETHKIEALAYEGTRDEALVKLKAVIENMDNAKIITQNQDYLYAEFTSSLMGFVDDVEFYVNEDKGLIEVRSASRLGESDLGVNRQRIEAIRKKFS
ncbi:MAG TPA: DUF1499 domain-containing protein [Oscillatoriaceae cyanobacterium M33_DOE_052]|uniref:DUF1499 domain-containing protein n=1 Tax=Planktothricoides sp. SpSt-374 TaxID=2282167 RepID=A0A7C3VMN2_9CYAN|nr:DUF1499 domain-containing protein [Oscillatoriaceae cyanobacterium M33_DOE_052]